MDLHFLTIVFTFLLLGLFAITGDSKTLISAESQFDCSSSNMTVKQLKAAAHTISCPENDEQDFWVAACECIINELPKSQCPVCRISREAEQSASASSSENSPAITDRGSNSRVTTRYSAQKNTSEMMDGKNELSTITDSDQQTLKLRSHNASTLSTSVNFIRFGK